MLDALSAFPEAGPGNSEFSVDEAFDPAKSESIWSLLKQQPRVRT